MIISLFYLSNLLLIFSFLRGTGLAHPGRPLSDDSLRHFRALHFHLIKLERGFDKDNFHAIRVRVETAS